MTNKKTPKQWAEEYCISNNLVRYMSDNGIFGDVLTMAVPKKEIVNAMVAAAEYWGRQGFEARKPGNPILFDEWWESVNKEES